MTKKTRIIAIIVGAALLISLAGGIGVMAADPASPTPSATPAATQEAFLNKLAAKLNIPVDQLKEAITAVEKETSTQFLQDRLSAMVAAGKMTQAQADEYLKWWQTRPTLPSGTDLPGLNGGGRGMMGGRGGMMRGGFPGCPANIQQSIAPSATPS